jgi:crotonobetainyl-CoA:carnitine CoA-transferase CaiB-like acyl-CoA transferase
MAGPLDGIRVVDLSAIVSGPLAAMLLADQGADVIKVEPPGIGDLVRHLGTSKAGLAGLFLNCNRGKRSVTIDMKQQAGIDAFLALADTADVIVQNFRPGATDRLGIGYEAVSARNPGIVYCSISGFGSTGPYAKRRVYDNVIQAYSGFAAVQTNPATGEPAVLRNLVCDKVTAYTAAQAITSALFARERAHDKRGQHIELAMLDAAIAFLWPDGGMDEVLRDEDATRGPTIGSFYTVTKMANGYTTGTAISDAEWAGWCNAMGRPELIHDERFASLPLRMANAHTLVGTMMEIALGMNVEDFIRAADEHDVPAAPVLTLAEVAGDAQVRHNGVFVERTHNSAGGLREVRPAPRFSSTPAAMGGDAPGLGEHTDEVMAAIGLDVEALRATGAFG